MSDSQDQAAAVRPAAQSRRALLIGAGVTCAAALAGLHHLRRQQRRGWPGRRRLRAARPPQAPRPPLPPRGAPAARAGSAPAAAALATTAEVPEGGGKIINGKNIVLTQPQAGTFKAFTAVCTHQGCIVTTIANGTIDCPCHGSKFSIKDGSVVNGPAASPLAPVAIKVQGTSIVQG